MEGLLLLQKEMKNRLGPAPPPLSNLFKLWKIKCLGAKTGVLVVEKKRMYCFYFFEKTFLEPKFDIVFKFLSDFSMSTGWEYQFKQKNDENFVVVFKINNIDISSTLIAFLNKLSTLFKS